MGAAVAASLDLYLQSSQVPFEGFSSPFTLSLWDVNEDTPSLSGYFICIVRDKLHTESFRGRCSHVVSSSFVLLMFERVHRENEPVHILSTFINDSLMLNIFNSHWLY